MKFSYNWIQDYLSKKISPQKMAELLTMRSFQVESLEKRGGDFILDIDILPNRGHDCFSHLGISRETAAISGLKLKIPETAIKEDKKKTDKRLKIEVREKSLCPRYSARIMTGVKVGPSPGWIRERLESIGQKPINNIVDIANFVMLELGQPLHAFDLDKLAPINADSNADKRGLQSRINADINADKRGNIGVNQRINQRHSALIVVRRAKRGEKIIALDGEKYDLDERILVIADAKNPVAIAGIKGGSGPGVGEKTETIVLESASFDSRAIRSASRALNLRTDASMRFEQGIDPNLTEFALSRACFLIRKYAGGKAVGGMLDFYPKKVLPKRIKLELEKANKLAGFRYKLPQAVKILNSLGFKTKILSRKSQELMVEAPTLRMDVEIPEDLAEEISRVHGYESIPSRLPEAVLAPSRKDDFINLCEKIKTAMAARGFCEVYNYSFLGEGEIKILEASRFSAERPKGAGLVELENPASRDFRYLRDSLLAGLLKNIARNSKNFKEVKIFEIGKVFRLVPGKNGIAEQWRFSGAIWRKSPEKIPGELFYELKGTVDGLLDGLGIGERWYDNAEPTAEAPPEAVWNLARSAEIKMNGSELGFIGELRAGALEKFDIPSAAAAFDFDLENLVKFVQEEREYLPIPRFPAAIRDIAVLVGGETRISDALNVIYSAGAKYIEDVDLFDIYEGAELGQGKKSLAFHLIFQVPDRTLTDAEVNEGLENILKALREELGAEIRK